MTPLTVRVDFAGRRGWDIAMPEQRDRMSCQTLDDAKRLAHECAQDHSPCEVIVCDAYHRVLYRELVAAGDKRELALAGSAAD